MASVGQISTHSPHPVHRPARNTGRRGAGPRACSGQVSKHAPHAVQASDTLSNTSGSSATPTPRSAAPGGLVRW
jgi:hypothetical protein